MKKTALILSLAFVLVLAALVSLKFSAPKDNRAKPTSRDAAQDLRVPEFTSATFNDGDALAGLGANWTYLRQTAVEPKAAPDLDGTKPTRESVAKLLAKPVELILNEAQITDAKKLATALKPYKKTTVAGRDGYLIPAADLAGGTQFALVGTSTVLLIQGGTTAVWPEKLDPEVTIFIQTVRVP